MGEQEGPAGNTRRAAGVNNLAPDVAPAHCTPPPQNDGGGDGSGEADPNAEMQEGSQGADGSGEAGEAKARGRHLPPTPALLPLALPFLLAASLLLPPLQKPGMRLGAQNLWLFGRACMLPARWEGLWESVHSMVATPPAPLSCTHVISCRPSWREVQVAYRWHLGAGGAGNGEAQGARTQDCVG